ncbi:DEAD/DEAH box helicase [Calothrix sp. 336/3]|uniref:DEAD/DEAH box helicase n=1 Tax=Calothrix sp. 336/3 TaxID=1337936 RepID=UPI0004E2A7AB|nr:DEAD/DEAH box helicase [Calothrix sp. 336/3]AKG22328.1 ATP-dependent helicase [Calothrix sp. 336/3]
MTAATFAQLAPFIQEYIYEQNWTELRPVQLAACQVIFETDSHLLIAAGTAAGKTEAAFLPVITQLHNHPCQTIGALYIGPIKALINDQFSRLNDLLKTANIPVYHWHGDVAQNSKKQVLKNPQGILQITPESLESLLINKHDELIRIFGELRFVIIDEIHAFMGTERGYQILCQLQRLAAKTKNQPRRIGLSATLGDYCQAEEWLRAGTEKSVITPQIDAGKRQIKLGIEHFFTDETQDNDEIQDYEKYVFQLCQKGKCLIFANNKSQTESIITSLRAIAKQKGEPDIYHVHHGSIAPSLRQAAETAMQTPNIPAVTAATLTLEVGVDIGHLEKVIQLESPASVASFLQRLGRAGRRGEAAEMRFIFAESETLLDASFPEQIPWQLLQCIAIIQLYLEERWIEPIKSIFYPYSLLYHQIMSILAAEGELSPGMLAHKILSLSAFKSISQEDLKILLRYLIDIQHIQRTETGKLIIGLAGERIVNRFQFYAVFQENREFTVKYNSTEIGSIAMPLAVGNQFGLAGKSWEVVGLDFSKRNISVKPIAGKASIFWRGASGSIHPRIIQRIREILIEDVNYSYLQKNANKRVELARKLAVGAGLDKNKIIRLGKNKYCIFPWMGTVGYRTLERLLNNFCRESLEIQSIGGVNPYYLILRLPDNKAEYLHGEITSLCEQRMTVEDLLSDAEAPEMQKYDAYIPQDLLRKAFAHDYLDLGQVREF